ncbi:solute carrier family 28 member 3 isoform X2 [Anabrus simplex]
MVFTCTGLFYFHILKRFFGRVLYKNVLRHISTSFDHIWQKRLVRIALYLILPATLIAYLVWDTSNDRERLKSMMGVIVFMLLGFLFSKHPGKIQWRPVVWGLVLQFLFGLISIRWSTGRQIFQCIGDKFTTFLSYTDAGTNFMYGNFLSDQGIFAFKVLPVIFFFSLVVQVLYYWGTMQWIVLKLGWLLQVSMGTTVCESVNAAASVFLGLSEAPLLIKPYISDLTKSELHAVMCAGFSTVAGTVLAAYISFGVKASHVITASIMSAPAALCYAKLFYPETEKSQTRVENMTLKKGDETGVLDAATKGAMAGTALVLGITANIIAFVAAVEFLDGIISWLAHLVGSHEIDFKKLLSLLFIPVVWLMGVHPEECENVAELVGLKTVVNEFVAYQRLGDMKKNGTLSERSETIATYALCGFSNPGSIGILIASLSTMAPHRRSDITQVAVRAFIAGCAVCFLTASIAGLLTTEENSTDNLSLNATSTMKH